MDGLIVYGSKYGTTRRYAEELSRLTGLPAIPCGEFHRLAEGSILVYLGALYAGGVLGLKQAMKGLSLGDGQRLIVATVGLADPNNPQNRAHILASLKRQMSPVLFSQAIFFHLRGGIDYAVPASCNLDDIHELVSDVLDSNPASTNPGDLQSYLDQEYTPAGLIHDYQSIGILESWPLLKQLLTVQNFSSTWQKIQIYSVDESPREQSSVSTADKQR